MKWKQKLLMSCPYCKAALTLNIRETRCFPTADLNTETICMQLSEVGRLGERNMELLCERCFREYSFEITKNEKHEIVIRIRDEIVEGRQRQSRCYSRPSLEFRTMRSCHITKDGDLATRNLTSPIGVFSCSKFLSDIKDDGYDKKGENKMDTNLLLQCPDCHVPLALEFSDVRTFQVSSSGIEIYCSVDMVEKPERQTMQLLCPKCKRDYPFEIKMVGGYECIKMKR